MARQRTLKPEMFKDARIAKLGCQVAIVYEALWCIADDGWVARIEPDLIKGEMLNRWRELTVERIAECLQLLTDSSRIIPYEVGEELYAAIPKMEKHQKTNRPSNFRYPRGGQPVNSITDWATQRGLINGSLMAHPPISESSSESESLSSSDTKSKAAASKRRSVDEIPHTRETPSYAAAASGDYTRECVAALNRAMAENPVVKSWMPVVASTEYGKVEWEKRGVPLAVAIEVIEERGRKFNRDGRGIKSLAYFNQPVLEAWEGSKDERLAKELDDIIAGRHG